MEQYKKVKKILKDIQGNEVAMIRVDKDLKDTMQEKPSGRWDAEYWHPNYESIMSQIRKDAKIERLSSLLAEPIIAPDHVRASRDEKIGSNFSCEYRTLKDLMFTGLNYAQANYCSENAYQRLRRTHLKVEDILFAGSGVGAIGRVGIVEKISKKSCVGDLFLIRADKVNQYYLYVYLLTQFGQSQIERIFHGVQSAKISTEEIGLIKVVILSDKVQANIESEYKKMSAYHFKAMDAKIKGDQQNFKKNIEIAEKMLKDLIARTEAVIRGERDDVI
jgi:hypothetical protein